MHLSSLHSILGNLSKTGPSMSIPRDEEKLWKADVESLPEEYGILTSETCPSITESMILQNDNGRLQARPCKNAKRLDRLRGKKDELNLPLRAR